MAKKSRKVRKTLKSKAFMTKKMAKGNIPLDTRSDDSDADAEKHLFSDDHEEEVSTDDEGLFYRKDDGSEEEEVLPITDDEDDDRGDWKNDEDEKEESEEDEEKGLPNRAAWGKKKSTYFNADFVDHDWGKSYREKDAEKAKAEEEAALIMQRDQMNFFGEITEQEMEELPSEQQVEVDPRTMDEAGKLKYLKKKYPHMMNFIKELNEKLTEINDKILPVLELAEVGAIQNEQGSMYVKIKYQLLMHYAMNLLFYMHLVAKGLDATNHPVVGRIAEFRAQIEKINFEKINSEIAAVATKLKNNEKVTLLNEQSPKKTQNRKITRTESDDEDSYAENIEMEEMDADENEGTVDGKRKITYQIAKNKGLTAKKRKELRNPRVKHRMKFRKAKIRRKGQVRDVIREVKRYDGEPTGISTHVVRSIKIK